MKKLFATMVVCLLGLSQLAWAQARIKAYAVEIETNGFAAIGLALPSQAPTNLASRYLGSAQHLAWWLDTWAVGVGTNFFAIAAREAELSTNLVGISSGLAAAQSNLAVLADAQTHGPGAYAFSASVTNKLIPQEGAYWEDVGTTGSVTVQSFDYRYDSVEQFGQAFNAQTTGVFVAETPGIYAFQASARIVCTNAGSKFSIGLSSDRLDPVAPYGHVYGSVTRRADPEFLSDPSAFNAEISTLLRLEELEQVVLRLHVYDVADTNANVSARFSGYLVQRDPTP